MSMAHSLELRVPILDKEVMKTAGKFSSKYHDCNEIDTKYALRIAAKENLPESRQTI